MARSSRPCASSTSRRRGLHGLGLERLPWPGRSERGGRFVADGEARRHCAAELGHELRDVEETTALLMCDGILFREQPLKIKRPQSYQETMASRPLPTQDGVPQQASKPSYQAVLQRFQANSTLTKTETDGYDY